MAWTIDKEALDRVTSGQDDALPSPIKEMFTYKYPVRVRILKGGPQGMAGKYHGLGRRGPTSEDELPEPAHHITISGNLSASMANTALWHEMTHAAQAERIEGDYTTVNRVLSQEFRKEMKQVRQEHGGSPYKLNAAYANVSFEQEAHASMKLGEKIDLISTTAPEIDDVLKDEQGRYTYRCDIWDTKWNKQLKRRVRNKFVATEYVVATTEWAAKSFAKKEYANAMDEIDVYKIMPLKKGGK